MTRHPGNVKTLRLSGRELAHLIDSEARARLGITGEEFMRQYHAKTLPNTPAAIELSMLVKLGEDDFGRQVSTGLCGVPERTP